MVIRPTGTFNNAREALDWLGVHHQLPEAQRYDCFAGIPARPPAAGRGVQPHQGADYPRRQSYAVAGHPTRTAVQTAEGHDVRPDHKHVGRAPHVATVTGKPGAQEDAAPGPFNVSPGKDEAHGAPASTVTQNAAVLVAHGVPAKAGTSDAPHGGAHTVQEPQGAAQLRPSGSVESFHPDFGPVSAPAGGFFSWIPKIFSTPDEQAPDQHIEPPQQIKTLGLPDHGGAAPQTTSQSPSSITYGSDAPSTTTSDVAVEGRSWEARSLCCVIFGMLLMPTCLFVLSYYFTPKDAGELPPFTSPTSYTGLTSSTTMATLPTIFFTFPTPSTADPWAGVPPQCFNSRAINDNISGLTQPAYKPFGRQPPQKIFCLYNNSRFLRGHLFDFVPENLPLDYCSYIVYWSVAVANASVSSRAQQFDTTYGLWKLRQVLQKHKLAQKVGVLMAIGGYPEDSVHFSRLGRDPPAMGRFVSNVVQTIQTHRLDGLTIHWVASQAVCQSADDERTMSTLVDKNSARRTGSTGGPDRPS
ncbi:hypothetical protein MTO96_027566 [Rhipicephalus appendiculatus]